MVKHGQLFREWVRWFHRHRVPPADIAAVLGVSPDLVVDAIAIDRSSLEAAWPFNQPDAEQARRRRIIGATATKIRRLTTLLYQPPRIAELLLLEPDAVCCFVRRTRRIRGRRDDRREPGTMIRPRTEAEELAAHRSYQRPWYRQAKRKAQEPPPGWSYADRSAASRKDAADLVAFHAAVREGRLSAGSILDLAFRFHFAEPRSPAPPEPAIWTGPESYHYGASKLDTEQVAEIRELRRAGWSTGKLARRFAVTRSTICNVLLHRTSYLPPCPAPLIMLPCSDEKSRISAGKPRLIVTAPWQEARVDLQSGG
jgi:hypothetical protein